MTVVDTTYNINSKETIRPDTSYTNQLYNSENSDDDIKFSSDEEI